MTKSFQDFLVNNFRRRDFFSLSQTNFLSLKTLNFFVKVINLSFVISNLVVDLSLLIRKLQSFLLKLFNLFDRSCPSIPFSLQFSLFFLGLQLRILLRHKVPPELVEVRLEIKEELNNNWWKRSFDQ